jgi:hypothetical protein
MAAGHVEKGTEAGRVFRGWNARVGPAEETVETREALTAHAQGSIIRR